MTPAAMSRSRIAVKARPMRDRARLRASSAKITSSTSISRYSFWSRVSDGPLTSSRVPKSAATGAGRPMPGGPAISVHSRNTYWPMKTRPSVTIARYSPRSRTASGATSAPAKAAIAPAAGSQIGTSVIPKPSTRPFGSPDSTAAVYAPMARKKAWPSETWPA